MRSNSSVGFIDAGYARAAFAQMVGCKADEIDIDYGELVGWFMVSARRAGSPLLRSYWYDGAYTSSHPAHSTQSAEFDRISSTPGIQLRLGHLEKRKAPWKPALRKAIRECGWNLADLEEKFSFKDSYEQKGVDTLIVLDMVRLAQLGVYGTAILLAGDRDLAEAIRTAQDSGAYVIVAHPRGVGISKEIARLSDETVVLSQQLVSRMAKPK
ncbi:NYN domain-containing protein [Streptomyces sp. NPDC058193]|uniref:NYN domain-containing protein n=1 Tax=Streptomyces sp. NPDC058193 TaxID=3346373 RepID=UPI0036EC5383